MMKTTKFLLAAILLLNTMCIFAQRSSETVYFYALGWEYLPQTQQAKLNAQPVVSNVVRVNCHGYTSNSSLGVDNQLVDFYKAYHAKQRGFMSLNRTVVMGPFSTWDEAENDRRKSIAGYYNRWNPLLLQYFKYLCEE